MISRPSCLAFALFTSLGFLTAAHFCQRSFRLRQPESHVHGTVQLDSGGDFDTGVFDPAHAAIQGAEAEVAVGHERAHAELLGQGQGLLVVGCGLLSIEGVGVGLDGAQLVERMRLAPTFLLLPGQIERLAGVLPGLLTTSRKTTDLAEPGDPVGMTIQHAHADTFADRLLQQRTPLREAPLERRGRAQACRNP